MDEKKLNQANKVLENINKAKAILEATKNQKAEWISFSYGNGSSNAVVCADLEEIEAIRSRLIASHEKRLKQLEDKFKEL